MPRTQYFPRKHRIHNVEDSSASDHENTRKTPISCFEMLKNTLYRKNLVCNLVYNIKLFIFAAQTGNATRCPTLLQKGRRGESEQKNN
jgi:hypothetical protein